MPSHQHRTQANRRQLLSWVCLLRLMPLGLWLKGADAAAPLQSEASALPASALLSYRLNGQEKGIPYQASGELRWQHNASAYDMRLSIKVFLLGSRQWRSTGQITPAGLAPHRFSDDWRKGKTADFDRQARRILFSDNPQAVPLQDGAQDQVSLYAQLAVAMAKAGGGLQPGSRLQIQTATVRDALPWLLTLEQVETLQLDGRPLQASKWVARRHPRDDAQVAFWLSPEHDWLPARLRISQANGSFIDLHLTQREFLPGLPPSPAVLPE